MWFFNTKKKGKRSLKNEENSVPAVTRIIEHQGVEELHLNDTVLRVWLPGEGKQALDEVVKCNRTTGARYLRELFVVYLYGEHELQRMRENSTGLYYTPPPITEMKEPDSEIRYSVAPTVYTVPGLGKSIVPIKLFLPEKIKIDLQKIAQKTEIPLSSFVREILISHLFGHTFWQERLLSWSSEEEAIGKVWEEDDEEKLTINIDKSDWEAQGDGRHPEVIHLKEE